MSTDISNALEVLEEQVRAGLVSALDALARIHNERLYLARFDSFDDYCRDRWGFSGRAGIRRLKQSEAMRELPPGAPIPSQREAERQLAEDDTMYPSLDANDHSSNAPDVISLDAPNRPFDVITPDAVLPPPAKKSESTAQGSPPSPTPLSDPIPEGGQVPPPAPLSGPPSAEGAGLVGDGSPSAGPNPTERLPSLRQETSHVFSVVMDATEGFGAKFTPEEATAYDNRHKREMAAFWKAYGIDQPEPRRSGYSRPAKPKTEDLHGTAGRPSARLAPTLDLTRREVAPMFKKDAK